MRLKFPLARQAGIAAALLLLSACTGTSSRLNAPAENSLAVGQEPLEVADGPDAGPDGAVYAVFTDPATMTVFESRDHERRALFQIPAQEGAADETPVKRSPNQQYVAYIEGYDGRFGARAVIVGSDGQERVSRSGLFADLTWTPDSQHLILLERTDASNPETAPAKLVILRPSGDETVTELTIPVKRLLGFTPDPPALYAVRAAEPGNPHGEVLLQIQPETGEVTELIGGPKDGRFQLLVGEELGTVVAYVREMPPIWEIRISRPFGGDTLVLAQSKSDPVKYAISPDVSSAAFVNDEGLWVVTGSRRTPVQVLGPFDRTWHLKGVEPDGSAWMFHPRYGYVLLTPGKGLPSLAP